MLLGGGALMPRGSDSPPPPRRGALPARMCRGRARCPRDPRTGDKRQREAEQRRTESGHAPLRPSVRLRRSSGALPGSGLRGGCATDGDAPSVTETRARTHTNVTSVFLGGRLLGTKRRDNPTSSSEVGAAVALRPLGLKVIFLLHRKSLLSHLHETNQTSCRSAGSSRILKNTFSHVVERNAASLFKGPTSCQIPFTCLRKHAVLETSPL